MILGFGQPVLTLPQLLEVGEQEEREHIFGGCTESGVGIWW